MSNITETGAVGATGLRAASDPTENISLRFAKLQISLAQVNKQGAEKYMTQIQEAQDQQQQVTAWIAEIKALREAAASDNKSTQMPALMKDYVIKHLGVTNDDFYLSAKEWDDVRDKLQNHLQTIGSNTQMLMVYAQDYMGQYNSYLQGSDSVLQQRHQVLNELTRMR
jgi:hypothetical protein